MYVKKNSRYAHMQLKRKLLQQLHQKSYLACVRACIYHAVYLQDTYEPM